MSEYSAKIAQRPTPNAQRPTPNAQRPTPNAHLCPKFSIIVPAYNTEACIARCLDSLIN
ncbi:MAG: glycosyltransferase [Synergistaceae bacterium]|nr:glycosyltransferase [Synergistaceae bacterium]